MQLAGASKLFVDVLIVVHPSNTLQAFKFQLLLIKHSFVCYIEPTSPYIARKYSLQNSVSTSAFYA